MKPLRFILAALTAFVVSACYTSNAPLVGDGDAAAPYASLTFENSNGSDPAVFRRNGNAYVATSEEGDVLLHLKPVEGDYYVAQLTGPDPEETPRYLYGYMRLDAGAGTADVWMSMGNAAELRPGLSACNDIVCIDDLDAYITYAKETVAAGTAPDNTLKVIVE